MSTTEELRYALVRASLVESIIVWDGQRGEAWEGEGEAPEGWVPFSEAQGAGASLVRLPGEQPVQIGWAYDGAKFVAPPAPPAPPQQVPACISKRQAHRALLEAGLLGTAESMIAAIEDPMERRIAQIEWDSQTYERASVFLQQFAGQLGLTPAQLDALFIRAAAL